MISRGAQLTPQEIVPLVAYLTATYGPDSPSPVAMSKSEKGTEITDAEHLPAGAGRQVLSRTCVRCHSLSLVTGARKSEVDWETTVARMTSFGAKLSPTDRQTLIQYLGKNLSNKK
jgi:cytochrome c5